MSTRDTCCTIVPYFKVGAGKLDEFERLGDEFVARTSSEAGCLYYGFSFDGDIAHCREGYANADALLAHLQNVADLLQRALQIAQITRREVHGPAQELPKLRAPLAQLNPQFFTLECGFRR